MPNVYILGPHPCEIALSPGIIPSTNPPDELHESHNSDGTQCLAQGLFRQDFLDSLPVGYSQISYANALLKRAEWDN